MMPLYPNDTVRCVSGVYTFLRRVRAHHNGSQETRSWFVFEDENGDELWLRFDQMVKFFGVRDGDQKST